MSRKQRAAISRELPVSPASPSADLAALFALAAERHNSGRLEEAIGLYDFALRLWPNCADAHANRAVALNGLRRCEEAMAACDAAIRLQPELYEAHFNRACAAIGLGRLPAAVADLDRALRIRPRSVEAHFHRGMSLKSLGRREAALSAFEAALRLAPTLAEAHLQLGALLEDLGRLDEALRAFDALIAAHPNRPEAYNRRATVQLRLGRFAAALADCEMATRLRPDYAEAHSDRAVILQSLGRSEEALAACELAVRIRPDFVDAHNNRAAAMQALGRWDELLDACDAALHISPSSFAALANRAEALWRLGRFGPALMAADAAVVIAPGAPEAHMHRGNALAGLGRNVEALAAYEAAIRARPSFAKAHANRGAALMDLGEIEAALAAFDAAASLGPDAQTHANRSGALIDLGRPEASLLASAAALALEPRHPGALNNRANALKELARYDEAEAVFTVAAGANPTDSRIAYNRSLLDLLRGDFAAGWRGYELRWDVKGAPPPRLPATFPVWRGEDLAGKSIIVYEEQGLGDTIQFARYLTRLLDRGANVAMLARRNLRALLGSMDGRLSFLADCPDDAQFDYQSALLSLPSGFCTALETIPAKPAYLAADPARAGFWRDHVGARGFRVGVAWQGDKRSKIDIGRSFPLAELASLSRIPNVRLVSLQKNEGVEQLLDLPDGMKVETLGDALDAGPDAFLDTAALMENLDLVISSDTAIAHLAGALGRPVWVALRHAPDWRWLLNCDDSPWYPSMRLFRQRERGDWRGVFAAMEVALRDWAGG